MAVTVRVPEALRGLTGGTSEITVEARTAGEALAALEQAHPGVRDRLFDLDGNLHRFVNVFWNDADIRTHDGLSTDVTDSTLTIVPAVAGG